MSWPLAYARGSEYTHPKTETHPTLLPDLTGLLIRFILIPQKVNHPNYTYAQHPKEPIARIKSVPSGRLWVYHQGSMFTNNG